MGGGGGGSSTTETRPWAGAQPGIQYGYQQARKAYDQTQKTPFGGDIYAGPTSAQTGALQGFLNLASQYQGAGNGLQTLASDTLGGKYLSPDSNPWLRSAVQAALDPMRQQLTQDIQAQQSAAISGGAYGGARNGLMTGQALAQGNNNMANLAAQMYMNNYQTERQNQLNAGNLIQQAFGLNSLSPTMQMQAGQQQQTWDQAALDAAYAKYQMAQQAPWAGLDQYMQVFGNAPNSQTSTGAQAAGGLGGAIKGALGGGATGAALSSLGAASGGAAATGTAAFMAANPWMWPVLIGGGLLAGSQ